MNVLSLFDWISCWQIALERAGIKVDKYFASEIDKYAIAVTQANYPHTIQIGSVENWRERNLPNIDLVIGGSPCQWFSIAWQWLNFDDTRSKLFFTMVDIINQYQPKYFLLENVKMKKEREDIITEHMEVEPIEINSALVSAQSRKRLYWTNIEGVTQPDDKGILLRDVLEPNNKEHHRIRPMRLITNSKNRKKTLCNQIGIATDISQNYEIMTRVYSVLGKCPTITKIEGGNREPKVAVNNNSWRRVTPLECERLQNVPDNYTFVPFWKRMMSNSQRYKMLGNGRTVNVISHIFWNIK